MQLDITSQEWRYKGSLFNVVIKQWVSGRSEVSSELKWNVYVYILEGHPLFDKVLSESLSSDDIMFPLHGGRSYHRWFYDEKGKCYCKLIGSDYNHIHDEQFSTMSSLEAFFKVYQDAEELFNFMEKYND